MGRVTGKGEPFYYFEGTGSDYEIGRKKGEELSADLAEMWKSFTLPKMVEWYGTPPEKYAATTEWLKRNLERVAPWMAEQLIGMSDGSGLGLERTFMTAHYGLLWSLEGIPDEVLDGLDACTSIASLTNNAGPVLGQNLEIGADDLYFVESLKPSKGHSTLSNGMLGMCCAPCGINDAGLAVGSSCFSATSQKEKKELDFGVPFHFLPRMVLRECGDVEEAVEYLKGLPPTIPPPGGYQLNLIDKSGGMAVVDKTNDRTVVRDCCDNFNFTTNCSLDEETEEWRTGGGAVDRDNGKSCYARAEMLKNWIKEREGIALQDIERLLLRHEMPGALCRHAPHEPGAYTRLSFLFFPAEGKMRVSNGNPCVNKYQNFDLNTLEK